MQFWNEVLHTALLGSDKKAVDPANLHPDLGELSQRLTAAVPDKEDRFLQLAAIALNYRQAGTTPLDKEGLTLIAAPPEEKPYCSVPAMQVLGDLLAENNPSLITFWLKLCQDNGQIVRPDLLPALLQTGAGDKSLRNGIIACIGRRGEWLSRLNPGWTFASGNGESDEQLWQTGSIDQRKQVLQQLRLSNPGLALEWLQQTWPHEDAGTKLDLLQQLTIGSNDKDLPFLESLAGEKSKKVKEQVFLLLKKIPSSPLVASYWAVVHNNLSLKKESTLLGLVSKSTLRLQSPAVADKVIYESGIEKLSNKKELTDDEFLLYQLMQWVPLSFYETHWQLTTEQLIRFFEEDALGKKLFPALILSIVHFTDMARAQVMMSRSGVFYLDLIPLLPLQQQDHYSLKFFQQSPDSIIQYAVQRNEDWGMDLTVLILQHAIKNPYQYNRSFFGRIIHLLPVAAADVRLADTADNPAGNNWNTVVEYWKKLLHLKKQTINAFN
jgi:Family of unknown function (DUF5691)